MSLVVRGIIPDIPPEEVPVWREVTESTLYLSVAFATFVIYDACASFVLCNLLSGLTYLFSQCALFTRRYVWPHM